MHRPPYEALFPCTGSSARAILVERLYEHHGAGCLHPPALALLTLDRMAPTRRVQEIGPARPDAAEGIAS